MLPELPPEARLRREAAAHLLEGLLLGAILGVLLLGPRRAPAPTTLPAPLEVDLARDPRERLLLLPGVGPARAAALLAARAHVPPPATAEDLVRAAGFSEARWAGLARTREVRVTFDGRALTAPPVAPDR